MQTGERVEGSWVGRSFRVFEKCTVGGPVVDPFFPGGMMRVGCTSEVVTPAETEAGDCATWGTDGSWPGRLHC